jgi:hypothetical protein
MLRQKWTRAVKVPQVDVVGKESRAKPTPGYLQKLIITLEREDELVAIVKEKYLSGLRFCYGVELARNPDSTGAGVEVEFKVAKNGSTIHPKTTGIANELNQCFEQAIEGWRFLPKTYVASFKLGLDARAVLQTDNRSSDVVLSVIKDTHVEGLSLCFRVDKKTSAYPPVRETVKLEFGIEESGAVSHPKSKSGFAESDACVAKQMQAWQFGPGSPGDFSFAVSVKPLY